MASVIFSPNFSSASCFNFFKTIAEISAGLNHLSAIFISIPPSLDSLISYGSNFLSFLRSSSENFLPISLFTENRVFSGFVICCLLAITPTNLSPDFVVATIDGVVLAPSLFSIIFGSPLETTAIAENVVPKSIPNILLIILYIPSQFSFKKLRRNLINFLFY